MRFGIPALVGLALLAGSTAQAQNIVVNPGFETGDFTGWTVTGEGDTAFVDATVGHTGTFAAAFGAPAPTFNTLSQILPTEIGKQYIITFFAQTPEFNIPPGSPNSLRVFFSSSLVDGPFTVPDNATYSVFSYTVTATSNASELRFEVSNDPDYTLLDDISVKVMAPEPGTLALMLTGVFGCFLVKRSHGKAIGSLRLPRH